MTTQDRQIVKTPSVFKVDDSFNDDRFMRIRIAVMHSGENLNKSSFATSVIREAKDSFANIPILASVIKYTDDDGKEVYDYGGHDAHIEEDAFHDGEFRMIYDEQVVGTIPESNNFEIIHDDESGNDFVYVDGYLYRQYGNYCCDVLESRDNRTDVSAEIYTDEISFDAKNQIIIVNKMRMSGVTLLGEDVNPAMKGANATVFSTNKEDKSAQLIQVMSDLKESLDKYTAAITGENSKKGGEPKLKFEELLEKYGKSVDDVTFEYEGLSDEELEAAFASAFEDSESEGNEQDGVEFEKMQDDGEDKEVELEEDKQNFATVCINLNGEVKEFSVSLQDKISALYELVNNTYADEDGIWYDVTVYDDDKYVIMVDLWTGKGYKQSYKVKKDVYTLVGDRVEVFPMWLTQDEIGKLNKMKSDYAEMSETLSHYEDEPQKLEILRSNDYSLIADNEDFVALCEQDNHFNMSVEEVVTKADAILTAAAKQHNFSVTSDPENKSVVKPIFGMKKKSKRFGSLFDGIM